MSESENLETEVDPSEEYAADPQWFRTAVSEHYSDTVNVGMDSYGVTLTFGLRSPEGPVPAARVHMSHQMAIVLERLMRRILLNYQIDNELPLLVQPSVLEALQLETGVLNELEARREQVLRENGWPDVIQ